MKDLSIIILSYNTKETTENCLKSLFKNLSKYQDLKNEVIVVDNASSDGSLEMIKKFHEIALISNKTNVGYSKGNNQGLLVAGGKYILFLNSDTIIENIDFEKILDYMDRRPQLGVLTVRVELKNGKIDPASHRGFPTVWNSFCYFTKLEKVFGKVPILGRIFGGYHLTYLSPTREHDIDSPTGAFYLVKKEVLQKVGGFDDKNFFMYGEDLDLSYRIKKANYKIIYYPYYSITHLKHSSGLKKNRDGETRSKTKEYFYSAMKMFYKKHYSKRYPNIINSLIYFFIDFKKSIS